MDMQFSNFPTRYESIPDLIDAIDPIAYSRYRNHVDGPVTYLSPYISRGVISTKQVLTAVLNKGYTLKQSEKLIQEMAWREYFQRVWQCMEDEIFSDIRSRYTGIRHAQIPQAVLDATTGIEAIDKGIQDLYQLGYMHNHLRMYTASISCVTAKAHWLNASKWMYYHLLDGDLASNSCSWQWVAGSFSSKQYYCNQENINKYSGTTQKNTFLDRAYPELPGMETPEVLKAPGTFKAVTHLPVTKRPRLDPQLPLIIYNSYNLDPNWRKDVSANRILLLEPSHFREYPVSEKVISFIIQLAKNIEGIQVFAGELADLPDIQKCPAIYSKEHPAFPHYPGIKDEREWLFPEIQGLYPSFFSYWKKCERELDRLYGEQHFPDPAGKNRQPAYL